MAEFEDKVAAGWSTAQDLAEHLNVSKRIIYKWANTKEWAPMVQAPDDNGGARMLWSPVQRQEMTKWYLSRRRWDGRIKSNRGEV